MAKSKESNADYREPATAKDTIEVDGCICQFEISRGIELHSGDFGEKISDLKEGVVIPAYDTIKEDKEIGE